MVKTKLQQVRIEKGLSQEDLANMIGMTQANYNRKENGLSRITMPVWKRIAKELNVPIEELYQEDPVTNIYKNNKGNSFNSGTIHISVPEFLIDQYETRLAEKDKQIEEQLELINKLLEKK
ncbi:MAG: helix-turn-helix domain-containing protein [Flavobacteriaceae bacterium]|jgi:DNA-binding XRE family transcriptional regulator|nr:helix-turn-helix domain-containing protein [Flavobacteriaceae bacterium]